MIRIDAIRTNANKRTHISSVCRHHYKLKHWESLLLNRITNSLVWVEVSCFLANFECDFEVLHLNHSTLYVLEHHFRTSRVRVRCHCMCFRHHLPANETKKYLLFRQTPYSTLRSVPRIRVRKCTLVRAPSFVLFSFSLRNHAETFHFIDTITSHGTVWIGKFHAHQLPRNICSVQVQNGKWIDRRQWMMMEDLPEIPLFKIKKVDLLLFSF